jgi:hypothetical protein
VYECISETEFTPALPKNELILTYFVNISPFLKKKLEIMKVYPSKLRNHPFPRNLKNIEISHI